jgi:hypothetical protein
MYLLLGINFPKMMSVNSSSTSMFTMMFVDIFVPMKIAQFRDLLMNVFFFRMF